MAIIAECSSLLIVSHDLGTAAFTAIEVGMVLEVLFHLNSLIGDTVLCISAYTFYLIDGERAEAVLTVELLRSGIEFKIRAAIGAFVFN